MQRDSTRLRNVEQLSLIPDRKIVSAPVSLEYVRTLKTTKEALEYACRLADVAPKEVYSLMEVDKSTWSRICTGELDLDGRDIPKFCQVVDNDVYLLYLAHVRGYDLATFRKAQDDKDKRIAELEQVVADQERAMRLWVAAATVQKGKGG